MKLVQVAFDYAPDDVAHRECFAAGARWALEQMTSTRAVDVGDGAVDPHVRRSDVVAILAAVRKEIES